MNQQIKVVEKTPFDSESFKMITKILEPEQVENYKEVCPELFDQQHNIFGIIDDFQ